jgi:hypothetical protein
MLPILSAQDRPWKPASALLGSYLTQIGLSESAVVYITKAAPTEMTWLNFRDAKQIGIDVIPWSSVQPSSKPAQSPGPGEDLTTHAAPKTTYWDHNGSIVYLIADGASRQFYYHEPRPGMLQAGARPGALLFKGRSIEGSYVGTAYIFSRNCGPTAYRVSGPILDDYRTVVLQGQAPRMDAECRVQGYFTDTLRFTFLGPSPPGDVVAAPKPPQP